MNTHNFQHAFRIRQGHIRRFSKAFPNFRTAFSFLLAKKTRKFEENLEEKEQNMPFGNNRTSDFFASNIRTFHAKHPYFTTKKSVLSASPNENQLNNRSFRAVDIGYRPPHAGWESLFRASKWTVFLQFRWQHRMSCTFFFAKSYAGFYTHIFII